MQKEKLSMREAFLTTFVKNLIVNSYVPGREEEPEETLEEEDRKIIQQFLPPVKSQPLPTTREPRLEKIGLPQKTKIINISQPRVHIAPPIRPTLQAQQAMPYKSRPQNLPAPPPFQPQKQAPQKIRLGKIARLLMDPAVFSVESPGPNKNILVNRSGQIQTTSVVLSKNEIDEIINEISDKTRIPVIPGVFRASLQDLLITAVISEFVGTRFIIQKKMPGMVAR